MNTPKQGPVLPESRSGVLTPARVVLATTAALWLGALQVLDADAARGMSDLELAILRLRQLHQH